MSDWLRVAGRTLLSTRTLLFICLAGLLLLAGCGAPATDTGEVDGYTAHQSIDVTVEDGLNDSELDAITGRAMARLEVLRDRDFDRRVPVEIINRSTYLANRTGGADPNSTYARWNNQVWESLFLVGEDRNIETVFDDTLGNVVLGYYSPDQERIVIVSDSETPKLSRTTLVHELAHALQDQHGGLNISAETQDRQLARNGLIEGEASVLEERYEARCRNTWRCVTIPQTGGPSGQDTDRSVLHLLSQPYVVGPDFIRALEGRNGWQSVNRAYEKPPRSSEQIIHPSLYPDEKPVTVTVPDRSGPQWERFDNDPVADTVGEASVFVMLVANQARSERTDRYSYRAAASAGWGGDTVVPYHNGDSYGYVWRTVWDTEADAREFQAAYQRVLANHDATDRGNGIYTVPDSSSFGDAFRVTRDRKRVQIVNAPSVDDLADVHDPDGS